LLIILKEQNNMIFCDQPLKERIENMQTSYSETIKNGKLKIIYIFEQ